MVRARKTGFKLIVNATLIVAWAHINSATTTIRMKQSRRKILEGMPEMAEMGSDLNAAGENRDST